MKPVESSKQTILIVEDEPQLANLLRDYLEKSEYRTRIIHNGLQAVSAVRDFAPDLVLLDLMLPGKDGVSVCREVREFSKVPIIMATARVEEIDRLLGLEIGADDYICKPYSPREVVARVKAVLRRSTDHPSDAPTGLVLDESRFLAEWKGKNMDLTAVEFKLLKILARDPGRIYSRSQLMDRIYDDHRIVSDRTIDSHIKKLRKKIFSVVEDEELIHSVYGVGYKFELKPPGEGEGSQTVAIHP
ncbi:MAG: two-component system response regulator BaeR [Gammaproteobacteria bacterium RIFCSPLOWO2_02_FULL_56_15]|nr:MAG: two-component system response regulator BaeR [Gammaproteobacteria bacterium RIFCSPLOWO2_02_FULL_56_15]